MARGSRRRGTVAAEDDAADAPRRGRKTAGSAGAAGNPKRRRVAEEEAVEGKGGGGGEDGDCRMEPVESGGGVVDVEKIVRDLNGAGVQNGAKEALVRVPSGVGGAVVDVTAGVSEEPNLPAETTSLERCGVPAVISGRVEKSKPALRGKAAATAAAAAAEAAAAAAERAAEKATAAAVTAHAAAAVVAAEEAAGKAAAAAVVASDAAKTATVAAEAVVAAEAAFAAEGQPEVEAEAEAEGKSELAAAVKAAKRQVGGVSGAAEERGVGDARTKLDVAGAGHGGGRAGEGRVVEGTGKVDDGTSRPGGSAVALPAQPDGAGKVHRAVVESAGEAVAVSAPTAGPTVRPPASGVCGADMAPSAAGAAEAAEAAEAAQAAEAAEAAEASVLMAANAASATVGAADPGSVLPLGAGVVETAAAVPVPPGMIAFQAPPGVVPVAPRLPTWEDTDNQMNIPCVLCGVRFRKPGHLNMHWRSVHASHPSLKYPGSYGGEKKIAFVAGAGKSNGAPAAGSGAAGASATGEKSGGKDAVVTGAVIDSNGTAAVFQSAASTPGQMHARPTNVKLPAASEAATDENGVSGPTSSGRAGKPSHAYGCPQCDSRFRRGSDRNRHMRMVHERRRPFACDLCAKDFGRKSFLEAHVSTVHKKERPYCCATCKAAFGQRSSLTRHARKLHGLGANEIAPTVLLSAVATSAGTSAANSSLADAQGAPAATAVPAASHAGKVSVPGNDGMLPVTAAERRAVTGAMHTESPVDAIATSCVVAASEELSNAALTVLAKETIAVASPVEKPSSIDAEKNTGTGGATGARVAGNSGEAVMVEATPGEGITAVASSFSQLPKPGAVEAPDDVATVGTLPGSAAMTAAPPSIAAPVSGLAGAGTQATRETSVERSVMSPASIAPSAGALVSSPSASAEAKGTKNAVIGAEGKAVPNAGT